MIGGGGGGGGIRLIFLLWASGVEFPGVPDRPKKFKKSNLIKMAQKRNRGKRKCHTRFFDFPILDLKLMPIDSELNSAPGNQTHLFSKK